jgi:cytochrome c oxidase subunit 2
LEILLTFSSFLIIIYIFYPTLKIISFLDNNDKIILRKNLIIVNIFGYQWYWNYFISRINRVNFDSNILNLNSLKLNNFDNFYSRNLDCNNRLILPIYSNLLFISLSDNVIHSWFIPQLNLKLEVNPGFINYFISNFNKIGLFFGNCAEICGQGHSNIPILIEISNIENFISFYKINKF